jgi:hypothetical protein
MMDDEFFLTFPQQTRNLRQRRYRFTSVNKMIEGERY